MGKEWGNKGYFLGAPQTFKGTIRLLVYWLHVPALYLLLSRHCLYSISEHLGRIISNAFVVSVDKLFGKHIELTL